MSTRATAVSNAEASSTTVIAADTVIRGEVTFANSAQVMGRVEGRISSPGHLVIGQGAECKASVQAGTLVVDGLVEGDVIATERLELNSSAMIKGDVIATKLVVSEGASFTGHCIIGAEATKKALAASQGQTGLAGGGPGVASGADLVRTRMKQNGAHGGADLESTLSGLESKLAGLSKAGKVVAATAD